MRLFVYARSGHRIGMEHLRRSSALCKELQECEPVLCTEDYRAAAYAKSELGVKSSVGLDAIGNLPHFMERGDILVYDGDPDTDEENIEGMKGFTTLFYSLGKDIPYDLVDRHLYYPDATLREKVLFFADDDYDGWFLNFSADSKQHHASLLLGQYFFLGNEKKLEASFDELLENEEYAEVIRGTKYLLTASPQSALESLASGNRPIFFKRGKAVSEQTLKLLESYDIPMLEAESLDELMEKSEKVIADYPLLAPFIPHDLSALREKILTTLQANAHIPRSMYY